ncbi:DsbA family protein [Oceanospirillum beijerinckii]|uniref:DsbA family protein n=1 Tax=Oceanospirillum beijerinckii TaxID=64976 RepID=UPI000426C526|nr:DsbA family protein [Oceanospirillum beijerinckii]
MSSYFNQVLTREKTALIYVLDPMCSWCWAFSPIYQAVKARFPELEHSLLLGGLAPDSDEPMPESQQQYIQGIWRNIEQSTGTQFNHDFWRECQPRRSTYPACRAVMVAREQSDELAGKMLGAIQQAYYQQAQNPSDLPTLQSCARQIGLSEQGFTERMQVLRDSSTLEDEVDFVQRLGVQGFPTLILKKGMQWLALPIDYKDSARLISVIESRLVSD